MKKRYVFSVFKAIISVTYENESPVSFYRIDVEETFSTKESATTWSNDYIDQILKEKNVRSVKLLDIKEVLVYSTPE